MDNEATGCTQAVASGSTTVRRVKSCLAERLVAEVVVVTVVAVGWGGRVAHAQPPGEARASRGPVTATVNDDPGLEIPDASASLGPTVLNHLRPDLRRGLLPSVRSKVVESFGIASIQVQELGTCRELFVRLGASGLDRLRRTLYYPAPQEVVTNRCEKGVMAATNPGSAITWLCPAFASLSNQRAAMTLIHEALHFAGMPERPQAVGALSSAEINSLVHNACRL